MSAITTSTDLMVGKFFHTTSTCPNGHRMPRYQGHVIGAPAPTVLLVEYFEWISGSPNGQRLITLAHFVSQSPVLYGSADEMVFSYEHGQMRNDECTTNQCAYSAAPQQDSHS